VLTVTDAEAEAHMQQHHCPEVLSRLDVTLLNHLVFKSLLCLSDEQLARQSHLKYTPDLEQALQQVHSGAVQAAWILNPTPLEAVMRVADHHETMRPKSTYFYPKPLSGLVFYNLESEWQPASPLPEVALAVPG